MGLGPPTRGCYKYLREKGFSEAWLDVVRANDEFVIAIDTSILFYSVISDEAKYYVTSNEPSSRDDTSDENCHQKNKVDLYLNEKVRPLVNGTLVNVASPFWESSFALANNSKRTENIALKQKRITFILVCDNGRPRLKDWTAARRYRNHGNTVRSFVTKYRKLLLMIVEQELRRLFSKNTINYFEKHKATHSSSTYVLDQVLWLDEAYGEGEFTCIRALNKEYLRRIKQVEEIKDEKCKEPVYCVASTDTDLLMYAIVGANSTTMLPFRLLYMSSCPVTTCKKERLSKNQVQLLSESSTVSNECKTLLSTNAGSGKIVYNFANYGKWLRAQNIDCEKFVRYLVLLIGNDFFPCIATTSLRLNFEKITSDLCAYLKRDQEELKQSDKYRFGDNEDTCLKNEDNDCKHRIREDASFLEFAVSAKLVKSCKEYQSCVTTTQRKLAVKEWLQRLREYTTYLSKPFNADIDDKDVERFVRSFFTIDRLSGFTILGSSMNPTIWKTVIKALRSDTL